jgi:hypothetical protein
MANHVFKLTLVNLDTGTEESFTPNKLGVIEVPRGNWKIQNTLALSLGLVITAAAA